MFILQALKDVKRKLQSKLNNKRRLTNSDKACGGENELTAFFDGMGSVTATEIIKQRIDKRIIADYGIDGLKNTGRYYIARVSEANGSIIHTLLVDKQNGMVRSLYRKSSGCVPAK